MLQVLIVWCYIAITAFLVGFTVLRPFEKLGYRIGKITGVWMAGLVVLTVYAQVFSLFAGVGLWANLIVIFCCVAFGWRQWKEIRSYIRDRWCGVSVGTRILLGILTIVMIYGASRGYQHTDTGLYHAQAIRWIEEYGVVPGLGNLHSRFGYNSAAFALTALYSLKWIIGDPLHAVQSFMALMLLIECAPLLSVKKRGLKISDFMRAGTLYYLTMLYQEMISPASDYFAMLMLLFVLISWLDLMERQEEKPVYYALLCLLLVWGITIKLSTAVILLLVIGPAVRLLKDKKWKEIGLYLGLGLGIALPWMIRGVLISGWLFYPFTFIDLFNVDWKIPKGFADFDAREIQVYARGIFDVNQYDLPFAVWVRNWFAALRGLEKLWVLAGAVSAVLCVISLAAVMMEKKKEGSRDWLLFGFVILTGWCFWLYSAPLVRYGYTYVIALPMGTVGYWWCRLTGQTAAAEERKSMLQMSGKWAFLTALILFLAYKCVTLSQGILLLSDWPYYVKQQEYGQFEYDTYEVDGVTIYLPVYGGWIGYDNFPSSPYIQNIELRGEGEHAGDLKYGFREKE